MSETISLLMCNAGDRTWSGRVHLGRWRPALARVIKESSSEYLSFEMNR